VISPSGVDVNTGVVSGSCGVIVKHAVSSPCETVDGGHGTFVYVYVCAEIIGRRRSRREGEYIVGIIDCGMSGYDCGEQME